MLRSQINAAIEHAKSVLRVNGFHLPPFAFWTPEEWRRKGEECDEIRACKLGWDVTDFASGDFARVGLVAFTIRNGGAAPPYRRTVYCEKAMIVGEGQRTPTPFLYHDRRAGQPWARLVGGRPHSRAPRRARSSTPTISGKLVGVRGFEPPTPSSRTRCATRLRYTPTAPSPAPAAL